jgi:deuterolysin
MKISSQLAVAALASYATAASVDVHKRETPLSVQLAATGNSEIKVKLTNNGEKTLNLLRTGTLLDEQLPVEKVQMYGTGGSKFATPLFIPKNILDSSPNM